MDKSLPSDIFATLESRVYTTAISPNGQQVVAGLENGSLHLFDLVEGQPIGQPFSGYTSSVRSVAFSPDGQTIVSGSYDNTLRLWNLDGQPIGQPFSGHTSSVNSVAFSPDGQTIVSGSDDNTLRLWNLDGQPIGQPFSGHTDYVNSVAFSPDGQTIVSGSYDNTLRLWNLDGQPIGQPFSGHTDYVNSVAFSPDGQTIVSGSYDNTLRLWNLDGQPIGQPFSGHTSSVNSVAFSPDGQTIVSGSDDNTLRLWNLDGQPIGQPFSGHTSSVNSVAFSPDGQTIVSGSDDNTLRLWNLDGQPIGQPFSGHTSSVNSVAFSPDGQTIVSGSYDNTLRLWNLDGQPIGQPFSGHTDYVNSVAFSPDGQTIVSGSSETSVCLCKLTLEQDFKHLWIYPPIIAKPIKNLSELIGNILISQGIKNDRAFGNDALDVEDEINALTEVLLLRSLTPPVAVGLLGNWGSGKSFGMHLIQSQIKARRRQSVTLEEAWGKWNPMQKAQIERMSPFVGHVYQIQFNAWTYAKSNLWASLMHEIFYELNRQITLEQKLGRFLSEKDIPLIEKASLTSPANRGQHYTPYKFLNYYILRHYRLIQSFYKSIRNKIYTFFLAILSFLDLAIGQLILHLGLIFLTILLIILSLTTALLQWLTEKIRFRSSDIDWVDKLDYYIDDLPFIDWFERQLTTYYFPELNHLPSTSNFYYFLQVIERSLFFFFEGFPKRIRDRITYWQRKQEALEPKKAESHSQQTPLGIDENLQFGEIARINQALRQGGNLWEVLYEINEADADALLEQRLSEEDRDKWNSLKSDQEISNVLWSTLDKIQRQKTQYFQALEQRLKEAEKTLERKQKSNEISVNQKLKRRKIGALWTPFFNGIARLKFSKEDIEAFSAAGKSFQKFRDTIKSWQGLLALFCMGVLIALTASSESRQAITQLLQTILNSQTLRDIIPEWIKNSLSSLISWLHKAIKEFPTWFQLGSATLISLLPIIKALTTYISSVQKEQARIQGEKDTLIQQSQNRVASEAQEVSQLRLRVEEERLKLGPNAQYPSLLDFVNARISGDDYGKHLGFMQQIKQDLAALSSRLTLNKGNEQEIQQLFPRGPARVFLYIDDLDRCPPDRVVEVLEAVQLLLNTKLFVVILAIDDRYIARALEQVYAGVLKRRGKPSGIDYLEKIIQIPYRMRPISPDTVEQYFRSQLTIKEPNSEVDNKSSVTDKARQTVPPPSTKPSEHSKLEQLDRQYIQDTISSESDKLQPTPNETDQSSSKDGEPIAQPLSSPAKSQKESLPSPQPSESYAKATVNPNTEPTEPSKASEKEQDSNPPPTKRNEALSDKSPTPEEVTYISTIATVDAFDEEELKLLVDCCKYVDITPRTGKRLINIYKILQIIWKTRHKEKDHLLPSEQKKRVVMSFLALSGRYPDFMRSLFDEIDMLLEQETFASNNGEITENPSIQLPLSKVLKKLGPKSDSNNYQDFHTKREWARFSTDIEHMVADSTTKATDPFLTLDRRTFSLMLSFCFVGDLGYDPDDHPVNVPSLQNPE